MTADAINGNPLVFVAILAIVVEVTILYYKIKGEEI